MKGLIYLLLQGVLLYETLAWEVRMPTEIHGLRGSCLVIPCSYSYTSYPPTNPRRVVWYQYVSSGYPLVYDPRYPGNVIDKFRGKTDIYNPTNSDRDCSLLIKSVDPSHNGEKLYTWIDPENIGWRTYKFYDVTSTIIVFTNPQQPIINISGGLKTGDSITVACYTNHTCPYSKPNITLKGIEGSDKIDDVRMENGQWKITLTRTGVVKTERSDIECTVTHHGDITTRTTKSQSAKCVYSSITIEPKLAADIIEGVDMNFTCTVHHSCKMNHPILSWNYEKMPVRNGKKQLTGFEWSTFSTITFWGAKKDDGKKLICTTNISGQKITASVDLHVQHSFTESPKPVTPVQDNISVFQNEPDVRTFVIMIIRLYIAAPSIAFLLICILAEAVYEKCKKNRKKQNHHLLSQMKVKGVGQRRAEKFVTSDEQAEPKVVRKSSARTNFRKHRHFRVTPSNSNRGEIHTRVLLCSCHSSLLQLQVKYRVSRLVKCRSGGTIVDPPIIPLERLLFTVKQVPLRSSLDKAESESTPSRPYWSFDYLRHLKREPGPKKSLTVCDHRRQRGSILEEQEKGFTSHGEAGPWLCSIAHHQAPPRKDLNIQVTTGVQTSY
ncbi:sialoadhesin-like [Misgurnus anguillicaudatus]|uniref:sialoadhesin-like n=1 Tax=Misgurnus anguillicaudatus TaxID=75329 RepID=UPI003CCF3A67